MEAGRAAPKRREALSALSAAQFGRGDYDGPARLVSRIALATVLDATSTPSRQRALAVAELVLGMPERVRALRLPESVLALYPRTLEMIARHIEADPDQAYASEADDSFVKDVRLVLGCSVPCGAQAVDLNGRLKLRSLVKHLAVLRDPGPLLRLGATTFSSPWYSIHTDSRDTSDFNERGWEECYRRIAAMLVRDGTIAGMVGSSWFYDPQLPAISPRLAYLQETPLRHGAVAIRNGPGAINTERATSKSETRKKLYEAGSYLPVAYTIAWPREALMRWADSARAAGTT